jgi:hypothetical protein
MFLNSLWLFFFLTPSSKVLWYFWHSSDIRNTCIFRRCSKRSIFKYFKIWKCEVKYVNTMSKTLSKLSLSCAQTQRQQWSSIFKYFLKSPKKRIIRVCLNRIESMSLLWFLVISALPELLHFWGLCDSLIYTSSSWTIPLGFTFISSSSPIPLYLLDYHKWNMENSIDKLPTCIFKFFH